MRIRHFLTLGAICAVFAIRAGNAAALSLPVTPMPIVKPVMPTCCLPPVYRPVTLPTRIDLPCIPKQPMPATAKPTPCRPAITPAMPCRPVGPYSR